MKKTQPRAGIGLRVDHLDDILATRPDIGWLELLSDNHLNEPYRQRRKVDAVARAYPVTLHSVGLSLGSTDPLDTGYLTKLKEIRKRFAPEWTSEHLCWTSVHGHHFHDLMPLPYTEETIDHVSRRIEMTQDFLGEQILIENVSSYLQYSLSEVPEWEFVSEVVSRADCLLLLDVNNIYVSGINHNFAPEDYLAGIPGERVCEIHLAGHTTVDNSYLIDSHAAPVADPVWSLYRKALELCGPTPTLIEWDNDLPSLEVLLKEAAKAEAILHEYSDGHPDQRTREDNPTRAPNPLHASASP